MAKVMSIGRAKFQSIRVWAGKNGGQCSQLIFAKEADDLDPDDREQEVYRTHAGIVTIVEAYEDGTKIESPVSFELPAKLKEIVRFPASDDKAGSYQFNLTLQRALTPGDVALFMAMLGRPCELSFVRPEETKNMLDGEKANDDEADENEVTDVETDGAPEVETVEITAP